jgi:hypothetical protein
MKVQEGNVKIIVKHRFDNDAEAEIYISGRMAFVTNSVGTLINLQKAIQALIDEHNKQNEQNQAKNESTGEKEDDDKEQNNKEYATEPGTAEE